MTFKDLFSDVAAGYAVSRPTYPADLADRLAELVPRHVLAWDAGCGSGQLSALLPARFERVVATDASKEQIAQAKPQAAVSYRVAPADASGLVSGSVDLCVAAQAAHWFNLDRYYAEVRRVGRPGGALVLITYARPYVDDHVAAAFDQIVTTLGPWWPPERGPVDQLYENLPFPFEEIPLSLPRMEARWTLAHLIGYLETWSSTQAFVKAKRPGSLAALLEPLLAAWDDATAERPIWWPLGARAGRLSFSAGE